MLARNTVVYIQDNCGVKLGRCIRVPKIGHALLGSVILISVIKRDPQRRRLRLGQLCRALVVGTSNLNFRKSGHWIKSFNFIIILKRSDNIPVSKRLKGPVCSELRRLKMTKIMSMGSYIFLK